MAIANRLALLLPLCLVLVACAGKIVNFTDGEAACKEGVCDGVFYYRMKVVHVRYVQDKVLDKDGGVVRFAGGQNGEACIPVLVEEFKQVPELKPSLISYKPGLFEDSKFSVEFGASGNITSVGVDVTSGAKNAAEAISSVATSLKVLKADAGILSGKKPVEWVSLDDQPFTDVPYCNAGSIPYRPGGDGGSGGKSGNCQIHFGKEICTE
ncbi:hypothetical protein [Pseudomonas putida]|uniref:hypothetical protein n=1 Tax=Pseudomonas putida TaxID=303 RepID=UPI0011B29BBD|nr:hypothetical protein [Pseudomonas putida]